MGRKKEDEDMAVVLNYKKKTEPALSRDEFLELFFNKAKRESTYKKFDEKYVEVDEDDLIKVMKKRIKIDD